MDIAPPELSTESSTKSIQKQQKQAQFCTKQLGIVIARDLDATPEDKKAQERELPFLSKESILELLRDIFKPKTIVSFIIAAEFGSKEEGFHYQIGIKLDKELRSRMTEYKKLWEGVPVYILYQKIKKTWASLVTYCKKDNDFIASKDNLSENTMHELMETQDGKQRLEMLIQKFPKECIKGDVKRMLTNIATCESIIKDYKELKYKFPEHLVFRAPLLYQWFNEEVMQPRSPENPRRKALVLFSEKRALGKTTFAKSIVDSYPEHYIICRNNFNAEDFKKPYAGLLILDDMTYLGKQREMWKALVTSERTSIREAYCNMDFEHGMPTIITTNEPKFFKFMVESEYFKYDCYFYLVEDFLGPPEADPSQYRKKIRKNFDMTVLDRIVKKKKTDEDSNKVENIEVNRFNRPINSYFSEKLNNEFDLDIE